jgi:parallel beta-helix repeat protein
MTTASSHFRKAKWLTLGIVLVVVSAGLSAVAYQALGRAPGEWLRYAEKRAIGHPSVERISKPIAAWLRPRIERPITVVPQPNGQGVQPLSLPGQRFGPEGLPLATTLPSSQSAAPSSATVHQLTPADDWFAKLQKAQPGDIFELQGGHYRMRRSVRLNNGGTSLQPVTVRSAQPGMAVIESTASEGFIVQAPYWVFENLVIRGVCPVHSNCEHAFHVVGSAKGTVIRNNRIEDFNAHIKVNGLKPRWPDFGLIQFNTLTNNSPRRTGHPVTPIDIVAADQWQVLDNHIYDFIKGDGNRISYGVFMKGAGRGGLIARNLVICTTQNVSQPGLRVGVSLGGGGTDKGSCRDAKCITEHSHGTISGNVIAHCNDFGIYINQANQSRIEHNKLINTYGIDIRYPTSSAILLDNQHDGMIRARDGASLIAPSSH